MIYEIRGQKVMLDFERNNICSVKFDKPLAEDGAYDYSKFYDLDYLSTVAKQLFE